MPSRMLAVLALSALPATSFRVSRNHGSQMRKGEDCFSMYDGMPLLQLTPCTEEAVNAMWDFVESHDCRLLFEEPGLQLPAAGGCAETMAVCSAASSDDFTAKFDVGQVRVMQSDAGGYYRKVSGFAQPYQPAAGSLDAALATDFYSDWRDLAAMDARVEAAVAASGGAAVLETAGTTLDGRPMKLVRFRGAGYASGMPRLVVTYNLHAREWITGMAGVYAVERLAEQARDGNFLAGIEVVMMYMANPDGYVYSTTNDRFHRKNTRPGGWFCTGVDLNRNFNFSWNQGGSSGSRCSDVYHGTSGASEPETKVIQQVMAESPMSVFIDVHSYTQLILASWGYTRENHPRKAEFDSLGLAMTAAVEAKHGMTYRYGAIAQILYQASGGSNDYATSLGALGYCYELRPKTNQGAAGFAPPTSEILPTAEETYEGILVAIARTKTM